MLEADKINKNEVASYLLDITKYMGGGIPIDIKLNEDFEVQMQCYILRQIGATMKDLIILIVIIIAVVGALDALAIVSRKYKK